MARKKQRREREHERDEDERPRFRDGVSVTAKTLGQKRYIQDIISHDITICTGPAGCGKTAVAIGIGLSSLLAGKVERIVIMRPVKEACDESIGYLPGDLDEKMGPWAAPVVDNMRLFIDPAQIRNLFMQRRIEIIPLAYARGRSLNKAFIILDEAQNCSPQQFLMVLTRIGEGSKLVVNGDISQSDTPAQGLTDAMERLEGMPQVAVSIMRSEDIVRNPIISEIIARYSRPAGERRLSPE